MADRRGAVRPVDLGVIFPTTAIGTDPAVIRDFAQTAEGLGYRRLLTYDHVLGAVHADRDPPLIGPYTEDDPFHEPFVLLGFLAACTTTIELGVAVLVLPQRQTALVAKQAAEVDVLSGGRLVLAVGTGWNPVEYEGLGVPFAGRGRRLDEQVELLRRLWREPVLDYRGEFHRIDRAGILPRPGRGTIPVWFGGGSEVSLARAARTGDGFVFGSAGPRTHHRAARLRELLAEQGRDHGTFGMDAMIDYALGPQAWADEVPAWQAAGGTILSVQTMQSGTGYQRVMHHRLGSPAAHIAALGEFAGVLRGG